MKEERGRMKEGGIDTHGQRLGRTKRLIREGGKEGRKDGSRIKCESSKKGRKEGKNEEERMK